MMPHPFDEPSVLNVKISRSPGDSMGLVSIAEVETTVIFPEAW